MTNLDWLQVSIRLRLYSSLQLVQMSLDNWCYKFELAIGYQPNFVFLHQTISLVLDSKYPFAS